MLIAIWTLLLIFQHGSRCVGSLLLEPREKRADEDALRSISLKVEDLLVITENLGFRINTLGIIIDKHFEASRTEARKQLEELKALFATGDGPAPSTFRQAEDDECITYSYENLIDVRLNGGEAPESPDGRRVCPTKPGAGQNASLDLPGDCAEALRRSGKTQGVHKIRLRDSGLAAFFVQCWADPQEGVDAAWTIVQRRLDGSINFQRNWSDYEQGFGNMEGEFFLGLDKLHALTHSAVHELWIRLEDFDGEVRHANYSSFAIGSANQSYELNVLGEYAGNAGDSFKPHVGQKFTTLDVDNDSQPAYNCAVRFTGAWWYKKCHESNLNGQYLRGKYPDEKFGKGIDWLKWRGHTYSMKAVHMAIRPAK